MKKFASTSVLHGVALLLLVVCVAGEAMQGVCMQSAMSLLLKLIEWLKTRACWLTKN